MCAESHLPITSWTVACSSNVLCLLVFRLDYGYAVFGSLRNGLGAEPIGSKELQLTDHREPSREEV